MRIAARGRDGEGKGNYYRKKRGLSGQGWLARGPCFCESSLGARPPGTLHHGHKVLIGVDTCTDVGIILGKLFRVHEPVLFPNIKSVQELAIYLLFGHLTTDNLCAEKTTTTMEKMISNHQEKERIRVVVPVCEQ